MRFITSLLTLSQFVIGSLAMAAIDLGLPTENQRLFSGEPEKFYMYVDRYFDDEHTQPWEGGSYGYVRTSMRLGDQVIQTKFHEGIDIAPIKRDKAGNPLDLVCSIAEGKVAYISSISGRSSYGKYVVIEHDWDNSPVYSLYAHLADITCKLNDPVSKGAVLGRMGYTGEGITRVRAHVHLEIALKLSGRFSEWAPKQLNYHGNFNGMNLAGADVAGYFLAHKANPNLTFSQYLASYPTYYKVTMPNSGTIDIATRYPWLIRSNTAKASSSWEVSFSETGMPLAIFASDRRVTQPTITMVRPSDIPHRYKTRGLLSGEGKQASLSTDGKNLLNLLSGNFPSAAPADKKQ
jgi:murein DD-endopeptidase MepM/ murein hydrolase activator NlpD